MRRMTHIRGIAMGRAGDDVQVVVHADSLEISCLSGTPQATGWLCRLPVMSVIGFDHVPGAKAPASGPLTRLFTRKSRQANEQQRTCTLEMQVQHEGKIAKVTLAGTQADTEGLMCDLTAARRSISPTFDVAL